MFGPMLFFKERHLFTKKAQFSIISSLFIEIFVYCSTIAALIGICIKSDMFFAMSILIFAVSILIWKLLLNTSSEPNGKIKGSFYKQ